MDAIAIQHPTVNGFMGATLYVTVVTCYHYFFNANLQFYAYFNIKNAIFSLTLGKRIVFFLQQCTKSKSGHGSAHNQSRGAHDAPQTFYSAYGGDTHLYTPTQRLCRLDRRAPVTSNPGDATGHRHFLR